MRRKKTQREILEKKIGQYAKMFIAKHRFENDEGKDELSKSAFDLSDKHLKKTFENCSLPLKPLYYNECRRLIKEYLKEYTQKRA